MKITEINRTPRAKVLSLKGASNDLFLTRALFLYLTLGTPNLLEAYRSFDEKPL